MENQKIGQFALCTYSMAFTYTDLSTLPVFTRRIPVFIQISQSLPSWSFYILFATFLKIHAYYISYWQVYLNNQRQINANSVIQKQIHSLHCHVVQQFTPIASCFISLHASLVRKWKQYVSNVASHDIIIEDIRQFTVATSCDAQQNANFCIRCPRNASQIYKNIKNM